MSLFSLYQSITPFIPSSIDIFGLNPMDSALDISISLFLSPDGFEVSQITSGLSSILLIITSTISLMLTPIPLPRFKGRPVPFSSARSIPSATSSAWIKSLIGDPSPHTFNPMNRQLQMLAAARDGKGALGGGLERLCLLAAKAPATGLLQ